MGIKADAEKVLNGIERLATAYQKAKGISMPTCTITKGQFEAVTEAIKKEKIGSVGFDIERKTYKGVRLNIQ